MNVFYAADDGGAAGASVLAADTDPGNVTEAAAPEAAAPATSPGAAAQSTAGAEAAAAPFLSHAGRNFASADEVIAHLDRGTLNKQDYDQKMREFADQKRTWETERTGQSAELDKLRQTSIEYERVKAAINASPEAQRLWRQALSGQPTAAGIRSGAAYDTQQAIEAARAEWDEANKPMREWFESQQMEQLRGQAIAKAAELHGEGFDEAFVRDAIQQLTEVDTEQDQGAQYVTTLALMLSRARSGAAAGVQPASAQVPAGTRRPSGGASQPAGRAKSKYATPAELAAAQKAAINQGTPRRVLFPAA